MPEIRKLPPGVVNKIAAGEVIERPASVVKELLENAVDAGAARIDVCLGKGGTELIRVVDDGCGIPPQQLPLAIESHATSKIRDADDLFRVSTLGFRGEALASIAEVSQLTIRSRAQSAKAGSGELVRSQREPTQDKERSSEQVRHYEQLSEQVRHYEPERDEHGNSGYELRVNGGQAEPVAPCGCAVGTSLEVRNLFYNTPVRQRFMRTTQTELGHATEAVARVALAHPQIHVTLTHNDRLVQDLPPTDQWRQRIAALFGDALAEALIWVESEDGPYRISGFAAHPDHSRSHNRMQYLLLNGRHIRDRALQHALGEAYRGLLLTGRYPIAFLRLEMPADAVDVNVHPTKLEVRLADSGRVYSQLLGTLRTRFLTTDMTTRLQGAGPSRQDEAAAAIDGAGAERVRNEFVQWAKGALEQAAPGESSAHATETSARTGGMEQGEFEVDYSSPHGSPLQLERLDPSMTPPGAPATSNSGYPDAPRGLPRQAQPAVQIHDRYLITESDEGVLVIDQHALHERILYEQLREKVLSGQLETQRLLVPEPVHLSPAECAAALEQRELLAELGIEIEHFGGDSVLVSGYPAMLANFGPEEVLRQMVDHLMSETKPPSRRDVLDELLHMISCKAAIKAGDRLSPSEIGALLDLKEKYQDSHHCPHGRPTTLVFTREELDRRFKRI